MKESKLHIVGLEELDQQLAGDPSDPDYVNKAWLFMYCYKVLLCPKRYSHDWGACPYAHNNESARRRDPQRYSYSSCICPNTGKGECPHGMQCRYAHTLFEYWLHPARFRTQMCKAGGNCKRALCFFAHSPAELRQPDKSDVLSQSPAAQLAASAAAAMAAGAVGTGPVGFSTTSSCQGEVAPAVVAGLSLNTSVLPLVASGADLAAAGNTGIDSSSSNVSAATCQQGSSPTALNEYTGEFGGGSCSMGLITSLPAAPVAAGLLSGGTLSSALLANGFADAPAAAGASTTIVTSMPQLQQLLQHSQQQQQQQQQLVAGMAVLNLAHQAPVLLAADQLQPGVMQSLAAHSAPVATLTGAGLLPVVSTAAAAAPVYSSVMQGVTACASLPGYARMVPGLMQQQQQPGIAVAANGLQQVYQPGSYPMAGSGVQYAWMS